MFWDPQLLYKLSIKIAPYAKIPYCKNDRKYYRINYKAYREIYNTMYYVEANPFRTYFYKINNVINYYRKWIYGVELFLPDIIKGIYNPIQFSKLSVRVIEENTRLIKTEKGKWYIITRLEDYDSKTVRILIINALNGIHLYEEKIKSDVNIYIDVLSPIANRVLPIIHITRLNLYIKLFDIANENIYTAITFALEDIDRLVKLIVSNTEDDKYDEISKDNLLHYDIDYIKDFDMRDRKIEYLYELSEDNFIYARGVRFQFNLSIRYNSRKNSDKYRLYNLYNISCHIELDKEVLNCQLDFSRVRIHLVTDRYRIYDKNDNTYEAIKYKYYLSEGISDIYLSNCLYKDRCYYIYDTPTGIGIIKMTNIDYIEPYSQEASIYRYGKYVIIFFRSAYKTLAIIDKEYSRMGYWVCKQCDVPYQAHYELYYSKNRNKLIFLSKNLESLVIVGISELHFIFKNAKQKECVENDENKGNNKNNLCDVICCFNISELVLQTITRKKGIAIKKDELQLISHYIDTSSDILYILAIYVINKVKYAGVFSFSMSCGSADFKILYYDTINKWDIVFRHKSYYKLSIPKIFLYRFGEYVSGEVDIAYDKNNNRLINIRYNRSSIDVIQNQYRTLGHSVSNLKDLLVVRCVIGGVVLEDLIFLFIKSDLTLVNSMKITQI